MPIAKNNGAVATPPAETASAPVKESAPVTTARKLDTGTEVENKKPSNYEETKNRRILVQGITQAVAQSMSLAGLGHVTEKDIVASVKNVARELIAFVENDAK